MSNILSGMLEKGKGKTLIVKKLKNYLKVFIFLLPAMIPLGAFWLWPAIDSVYLSLTDWDYMTPSYNIVGMKNYIDVLTSSAFHKAAVVTVKFAVFTIIPSIFIGLMLALIIFRNRIGNGLLKFLYFSPWVTPIVAISIVWTYIFDARAGLVNYLLSLVGIAKIPWIESSKTALIPIIVVTIWSSIGWNMIFYLGALSKVPKELYEAAKIDGVGKFQVFRRITLPLISPTTLFLIVMSTISSLQVYSQIQVMTQGGPSGSTRTILYLYYQHAFEYFEVGTATSMAVILIIVTAILSGLQFLISKKYVHYN